MSTQRSVKTRATVYAGLLVLIGIISVILAFMLSLIAFGNAMIGITAFVGALVAMILHMMLWTFTILKTRQATVKRALGIALLAGLIIFPLASTLFALILHQEDNIGATLQWGALVAVALLIRTGWIIALFYIIADYFMVRKLANILT